MVSMLCIGIADTCTTHASNGDIRLLTGVVLLRMRLHVGLNTCDHYLSMAAVRDNPSVAP